MIILDSVYVRTLSIEQAQDLLRGILSDSNIVDRIVFLDRLLATLTLLNQISFSKSHGLCRERLGCYFSTNPALFGGLHAANIAFSAGPGVIKGILSRLGLILEIINLWRLAKARKPKMLVLGISIYFGNRSFFPVHNL